LEEIEKRERERERKRERERDLDVFSLHAMSSTTAIKFMKFISQNLQDIIHKNKKSEI